MEKIETLERIKELCEKNNIKITALCTKITGDSGNLKTWKKNSFHSRDIIKIAQYFHVSSDYLLGLADMDKPQKTAENTQNLHSSLTKEERALLAQFSQLTEKQKIHLDGYISGLLASSESDNENFETAEELTDFGEKIS